MKTLTSMLNRNPGYFIYFFIYFIFLSVYCISISKPEGFLLINQYHNQALDEFFILFTNFGNGLLVIGGMIFLLIRKKTRWALQIGISFLVSGIIAQFMKQLVHSPRPKLFFGPNTIHCIYGITGTGYSSFPSGHTTTIFALTTLLSLYFPGRGTGVLFFIIAGLTGFSRIYLSQHFPIDVLAGSLLGVLASMVVYIFIPLKNIEKKISPAGFETQTIKLQ
jgi:membrane-associated phospholipid phosphatase